MVVAKPAGRAGYTLVALVVTVAVMNVLVAAALPYWSQVMKRDREAELIFRGLQYAEAIRLFQLRFGRYPNTLEELIEVNPRSIRRLWKDPMSDSGEWQLIRARASARTGGGQQPQQGTDVAAGTAPGGSTGDPNEGRAAGPIFGVRSSSGHDAMRTFMGASRYDAWHFTADLIPTPVVVPGTLNIPRPTSDWIGRPFREGIEPALGAGPGELTPEGRPAESGG